jgi:hypothetical protein
LLAAGVAAGDAKGAMRHSASAHKQAVFMDFPSAMGERVPGSGAARRTPEHAMRTPQGHDDQWHIHAIVPDRCATCRRAA